MSIENAEQIIKLGSILMGSNSTQARGVSLLTDLADLLLPEKVTVSGAVEVVVSPAATSPAPAATPDPKPVETVVAPTVQPVVTPDTAVAPTIAPVVTQADDLASVAAAMTMEQLNAELVAEFKRLGGRDGIDAAIKALNNGNASVTTLPPAQYGALIAAVKAL